MVVADAVPALLDPFHDGHGVHQLARRLSRRRLNGSASLCVELGGWPAWACRSATPHFVTCEAWRPGRAGDPPRGLDQDRRPLHRQVPKRPDIRAMPGIGPRTTNWTVPVALAVQPDGPARTFALYNRDLLLRHRRPNR
jgi:hypothetical protein